MSVCPERGPSDAAIHLTRWGIRGPTIVLVHGGAQGGSAGGERHFKEQQELAKRGYQLIVPDRPGHGRSPAPGRPDDAEADAAWLVELLGNGAHVVGHSFGACVALAAAAAKPTAVRSLTLIEPAMVGIAMGRPAVLQFVIRTVLATFFAFSAAQRARRLTGIVRIPKELRAPVGSTEEKRVGEGLRAIKFPSKDQLTQWLDIVKTAKIPLLVVTGGWNGAFEAVGETVTTLGGGGRRVIRSEHHYPQSVSNEFNRLLAGFVDAAEARRPKSDTV